MSKKSDSLRFLFKNRQIDEDTFIGILQEEVPGIVDAYLEENPPAPMTVDDELSDTSTNPVQNKVVTGAVNGKVNLPLLDGSVDYGTLGQVLKTNGDGTTEWGEGGSEGGSGITAEVKSAILACFRGIVWKGDVDSEALYDALETALNPPANLASISVIYTQSGTVDVSESLESLRQGLVVTAHYSDGTSEVVTAYTLSGSLASVGEQTITVSYGGKTATFTVVVTSEWSYVWDFTNSLTDSVNGQVAVTSAASGVDAPAITNEGLAFTAATQRVVLIDNFDLTGKTIEIDVASMVFAGDASKHIRLLMTDSNHGPLIYRSSQGWAGYIYTSTTGSASGWSGRWTGLTDHNAFSNKTIKLVNDSAGSASLYIDGELHETKTSLFYRSGELAIGGGDSYAQSSGDQIYNAVISGVRIKDTEVE